MKHIVSTVGVTGVVVGVLAGAGSVTLLTEEPAAPAERIVEVPTSAADQPEDPDRLVQWLKQHRR